jgi:HEAT repeat protein
MAAMPWKRLFRWLTAFSLIALVFAGTVFALWQDEEYWEWNWENRDATIVGRALGLDVSNVEQSREFDLNLGVYDRDACARLLPLLEHPDPRVRAATARMLVSTHVRRTVKPQHLATLVAAHRNGSSVLPTIAAVGTPDAVDYVFVEMSKSSSPKELCRILLSAGPDGIKRLVSVYRGSASVDPEFHRAVCADLHDDRILDDDGTSIAVAGVVDVVRDAACPTHNRVLAMEVLSLIGDVAAAALPALRELSEQDSGAIGDAARQAIARIEGTGTMARYLSDLEFELGVNPMRRVLWKTRDGISSLGERGRAAGPLLMHLLDSPEWEVRVDAVRLLGTIGYAEAAPRLIAAMKSDDDWILTCAAAEALARLGSAEAVPELERVVESYWYPPVCALAAEAIGVILGETAFPPPERPRMYLGWARDMALDRHVREFYEQGPRVPPVTRIGRRLGQLAVNTWSRAWRWRWDRIAKVSELKERRPDCGYPFGDGFLLGYDNGQWGGRVFYVSAGKSLREFAVGNVHGFYRMPFGLVVVTSWDSDEGIVYLIGEGSGGLPTCEPYKRLPFEVFGGSDFVAVGHRWNGDLLISGTYCDVVLTRSGELRVAD